MRKVMSDKTFGAKPMHKSNSFIKEMKTNFSLFILLVPGFVVVLLMSYLPLPGILMAFQEYRFYTGNFFMNLLKCKWVWFDNFWLFFNDKYFTYAVQTTIEYNLFFLVSGTTISLIIAIVINELTNRKMSKLLHNCMLLPYLLSWVVFSYVVFAFLGSENGFINRSILSPLGLKNINFYINAGYWPVILFIVNTIKFAGYGSILYLSAIVGIDPEYYESAIIDGATKWQQITKITVPLISHVVIITVILTLGNIMTADFGLFYNVPRQSPFLRQATDIVDIYVYRKLQDGKMAVSAAAGLLKSVIGLITVLTANFAIRKIDREKALF